MMLIWLPFQKEVTAADVIVMPRFLFLFHPVGRRGTVVRLADLVVDARVEQDSFRHGRLAGIDVSHDAVLRRSLRLYLVLAICLLLLNSD